MLGAETTCDDGSCQGTFHDYALERDRRGGSEELRWYVDGRRYHTVKASEMDPQTWANATHGSMTIILNVAMGGDFPNAMAPVKPTPVKPTPVKATKSGVPMVVKYVSVPKRH
jgi:beta-glucanase (GH16 family)